jgi:hypothetical protein
VGAWWWIVIEIGFLDLGVAEDWTSLAVRGCKGRQ